MKLEDIKIGNDYYYKEEGWVVEEYICSKCKGNKKLQLIDKTYIEYPDCRGKGYLTNLEKGMQEKVICVDFIIYDNKLDKYFGLQTENETIIIPIEKLYEYMNKEKINNDIKSK